MTLPVHGGYARMKTGEHWKTDVLAGIVLGATAGWYRPREIRTFALPLLWHGEHVAPHGRHEA